MASCSRTKNTFFIGLEKSNCATALNCLVDVRKIIEDHERLPVGVYITYEGGWILMPSEGKDIDDLVMSSMGC